MNLHQIISYFLNDPYFSRQIQFSIRIPKKLPEFREFPSDLDQRLVDALKKRKIHQLYIHQYKAYEFVKNKKNVLLTTSTASGKTLGYILPILQYKIENPESRTLLLYPTKALSRDQENWIQNLCNDLNLKIGVFTYDGDTSTSIRKKIRESGDFIITNPDMLHANILPQHTSWIQLFEHLDFIVIDEVHTYKGIFGSHFANVLRRLFRITNFYHKDPIILAASATIGNPQELIERLTEKKFEIISEDGSGKGEKVFFFYNPPKVIENRNENTFSKIPENTNIKNYYRISSLKEAVKIAEILIKNQISTILFCRSRKQVELLTNYLKEQCPDYKNQIQAYRSGYLPEERRKIEKDLRAKNIIAVVSTNALELGIDIGSLEVSISVGYPGSIHSLYQQAGRAGRKSDISLSILIASQNSLDQYIIKHPEFITEKNPENVRINPDNLWIVSEHLKCSLAEKPFLEEEQFGNYPYIKELLEYFVKNKIAIKRDNKYYWCGEPFPSNHISLRSGPKQNFVIIDITDPQKENVIGEMDYFSAPLFLHPQAIYLHQTETYFVEELLWDERIAKVKQIDTDYYTEAEEKIEIKPLYNEKLIENSQISVYKGEISLQSKPTIFKKIKFHTHENIGWGEIHLPEIEMHTQSFWILFESSFFEDKQIGIILSSMAHSLSLISTIIAMCEKNDIRFVPEVKDPYYEKSSIYVYDNFPGGLEISYFIYRNFETILEETINNIKHCDCEKGCPACIGLFYLQEDINNINFKIVTEKYLSKIQSIFKNI
ncbi:MAG: putative ATP-dependent helicase YprA [Leptospiraceae bacterium]|nr:MAG: putative ATP-dependent helicase YprA [Leptospiraceae bacterium]